MEPKLVTIPLLALIAGTRVALGAGAAFLLGSRLSAEQRRAVGWALLGVGALSTIPLAAQVLFQGREELATRETDASRHLMGVNG